MTRKTEVILSSFLPSQLNLINVATKEVYLRMNVAETVAENIVRDMTRVIDVMIDIDEYLMLVSYKQLIRNW